MTGSRSKKKCISGTIAETLLKNGKQYALQQAYKHATNSMKYSGPVSKAAKRGIDLEPVARNLLRDKLATLENYPDDLKIDEVGFVLSTDYDCVGCSPDGVIYDNDGKISEICEIKCFGFKHHESCHERIDDGIMSQIQWNMWVTQSELCYFVQYNPDYLDESLTLDGKVHKDKVLYITRIYPKKEYQSSFINALK
jgi:cyanate lyase